VIYVACGDSTKLNEYREMAKNHGLIVKDKWDVVDAEDRAKLEQLSFDQLGVVDYIVLKKAIFFVGVASSSLSHQLGHFRHLAQFGDLEYIGKDFQQFLIGKQWMRNLWVGNMWS
jgi:hypothetical protein